MIQMHLIDLFEPINKYLTPKYIINKSIDNIN